MHCITIKRMAELKDQWKAAPKLVLYLSQWNEVAPF
jgi:hypothetical protein